MNEIEKLIASAYFDEVAPESQTQEEREKEYEAEEFYENLILKANRIKIPEIEDSDNSSTFQELSQSEYNEQKSFELGLTEIAEFDKEDVEIYNGEGKKIRNSLQINKTEDAQLPVNIIKLSEYTDEIVRDVYPATISDIVLRQDSRGIYLRIKLLMEVKKYHLEFQCRIYEEEYGNLTQFLIENFGIEFNHKKTDSLSSLRHKKIFVEFEKIYNGEYFEIHSFRKEKNPKKIKKCQQLILDKPENSKIVFQEKAEISVAENDLKPAFQDKSDNNFTHCFNYESGIVRSSITKRYYEGYISNIKTFTRENDDGSKQSYVRLECHILQNKSIVKCNKDIRAVIDSSSELSRILLRMGVPVLNIKTAVDLDIHLKGKPIFATLSKFVDNSFEVDEIFPKIITTLPIMT